MFTQPLWVLGRGGRGEREGRGGKGRRGWAGLLQYGSGERGSMETHLLAEVLQRWVENVF